MIRIRRCGRFGRALPPSANVVPDRVHHLQLRTYARRNRWRHHWFGEIRQEIARRFGYNLNRTAQIRPDYLWDVSCQGSVPEAIVAFLDSTDVEDAIRLAISLDGDADTQAAIAGGIAEAHYKCVPDHIGSAVRERLPETFIAVIDAFRQTFPL